MRIIALCELDTQKAWRQTCRALYLAASVLPLGQVCLAAREKILSAVKAICNEEHYRRMATGLVIDILMYDGLKVQDHNTLHAMYVAKQDLRKPGQNKWSLPLAKMEYRNYTTINDDASASIKGFVSGCSSECSKTAEKR